MDIIEFAHKVGYQLNSAQITILREIEKAQSEGRELHFSYPARVGKMTIKDICDKYFRD